MNFLSDAAEDWLCVASFFSFWVIFRRQTPFLFGFGSDEFGQRWDLSKLLGFDGVEVAKWVISRDADVQIGPPLHG